MKVVIAPDSFKECLPAAQVAAALAEGVLSVCANAQVDVCPMADGGEGTVDAVVAATGGCFVTADVFDPLGASIRARFGMVGSGADAGLPGELGLMAAEVQAEGEGTVGQGDIAVIEMAAASGLGLVPASDRDPMLTTTYGTGQLILAALDAGAREIIIGIGGSATVDGGAGCAQALGVSFSSKDGSACPCGVAGGGLGAIGGIDMSDRDSRLEQVNIRVACDVTNPLIGRNGAAAVYGPQKGATVEMVVELDAGLANLASVIATDVGLDVLSIAGGGAAGGLGAGLVAFVGARLESGVKIVASATGLPQRLRDADLCITGEGKLDSQSSSGKTCWGVAELAASQNVPVICIPGQADGASNGRFWSVNPLVADEVTPQEAMLNAEVLLKRRAAEAVREFLERS